MDGIEKGYGLKHLVEASRRITTHLELDLVLGQVVTSLTSELGAVYATVWLVEKGDKCGDCGLKHECLENDECLHLKAWDGPEGNNGSTDSRAPVGMLKIGTIAQSKSPYFSVDVISDPMLADPVWAMAKGIKAAAVFPLVADERLIGVLGYYGERPIDPELGDILLCFAHLAATAIEDSEQHERVRQSEETFKSLVDGAVDPVLIFDPDGSIINASRSACQMLGYDKDTLLNIDVRDLDVASESRLTSFFNAAGSGGVITYETTLLSSTREPLSVEVRAGSIKYGGIPAVQAFIRDISERKRLERRKADLIAMITHDLRAPLSVILGYSEVIKDQYWAGLPDFVREGIDAITVSGEKLQSMIEDYLNLSKMEAGILTMKKVTVSIPALVNRAMDTVMLKSGEKGLKLTVSCPADLPDIQADPKHLERAVVNLLTNAVKYTPRGGSISVECLVDQVAGITEFSVTDTGIGIGPDELTKIFDKYYRSEKSGGKGVGLGLAIVKSVVEAHGGSVSVESGVGAGSTFKVRLPVA